jgi:hypothetical protein
VCSRLLRLFSLTFLNSNTVLLGVPNEKLHGTIPTELGLLTNLDFFSLDGNDLTGTIPSELGRFKMTDPGKIWYRCVRSVIVVAMIVFLSQSTLDLSFFNLSANRLTGTIPTEIFSLRATGEFWYHSIRFHYRLLLTVDLLYHMM